MAVPTHTVNKHSQLIKLEQNDQRGTFPTGIIPAQPMGDAQHFPSCWNIAINWLLVPLNLATFPLLRQCTGQCWFQLKTLTQVLYTLVRLCCNLLYTQSRNRSLFFFHAFLLEDSFFFLFNLKTLQGLLLTRDCMNLTLLTIAPDQGVGKDQ